MGRTGALQPRSVHRTGLGCVDRHVAVTVARQALADPHCLVPAVLPRHRVRVDGEGEILVDAYVRPPDTTSLGRIRPGQVWAVVRKEALTGLLVELGTGAVLWVVVFVTQRSEP